MLLRAPARQEAHLAQVLERLLPQRVEALGQAVGEGAVAHQERREAALRHERMIERQDHGVFVHYVERMPELARIAHPGEMAERCGVAAQEVDQLRLARLVEA